MATQADVRRIALALPGIEEDPNNFAFGIYKKEKFRKFAWVWKERVNPKKPRVPQPKVIVISVANLEDKEFLIATDAKKFFTEAHYDGYSAVHVRLAEVTAGELKPLIAEAYRLQAPTIEPKTPSIKKRK